MFISVVTVLPSQGRRKPLSKVSLRVYEEKREINPGSDVQNNRTLEVNT